MGTIDCQPGISLIARVQKRGFDFVIAAIGLLLFWWIVLLAALISWIDTRECGIFSQVRVGRYGKPFKLYKIRTMTSSGGQDTTVTTIHDARITKVGRLFRRTKIDELPQLINVLIGQMSFVGPRPDVPGFADSLSGEARDILLLRPGITGPATLYYRDEENLLADVDDAEEYNRNVIYPHKVQLNLDYIRNYSMIGDIRYIFRTIFG
jgi:lipopolysaccharide/colanic/teichoic acid biosynthesis glycosyltransferase